MNQIDLRAMNLGSVYHWSYTIRVRVVYNFIKIVLRLTDIDCEKSIKWKKEKKQLQHHTTHLRMQSSSWTTEICLLKK